MRLSPVHFSTPLGEALGMTDEEEITNAEAPQMSDTGDWQK